MSWENLDILYRSKVALIAFVSLVALRLLLFLTFVAVSPHNDYVARVFLADDCGFVGFGLGVVLSSVFPDMSATLFVVLFCAGIVALYIPCFFILSKNVKTKLFSATWCMTICIIDLICRLIGLAVFLVPGGRVGWKPVFLLMSIAIMTFTIIYRRAIRQNILLT